jgi:quercetin dioxygenase-like cupin family protein
VALAQDHTATIVPSSEGLKWGESPALPKGHQIAVVIGDPAKAEPYVVRIRMPAGFTVPPHMHPNVENVTVLSGDFGVGEGDTADKEKSTKLKPGAFFSMPAGHHHYAHAVSDAVIQLHGVGPSGIEYVNPKDDPRKTN